MKVWDVTVGTVFVVVGLFAVGTSWDLQDEISFTKAQKQLVWEIDHCHQRSGFDIVEETLLVAKNHLPHATLQQFKGHLQQLSEIQPIEYDPRSLHLTYLTREILGEIKMENVRRLEKEDPAIRQDLSRWEELFRLPEQVEKDLNNDPEVRKIYEALRLRDQLLNLRMRAERAKSKKDVEECGNKFHSCRLNLVTLF